MVGVYDRGEWEGTYYIAMEHLEGRSLKQMIQAEAPLEPERAIDFTLQILKAARFAHKRGVIHRDLKPHNVIVDDEGRAKVTDFGIARAGASDMTETGSIMGTAQYLSPEQAQGHAVSATSDLYSVGIILYELLAGRVPFDGDSAVTIALKQVSEQPVSPRAYNQLVTPELEAVVMHALRKDPAARYQDAGAFIAALERARAPGRPRGAVDSLLRGRAAHRPDGLRPGGRPARPAPDSLDAYPYPAEPLPPEVERRRRRWPWVLLIALALVGGAIAIFILRGQKVTVPDVVRKDQTTAVTILQNRGLDPATTRVTNATVPEGRVFRESPAPGSKVKKHSKVSLLVSAGPGIASIPDVSGLNRKKARQLLEKSGFNVQVLTENSSDVPKGQAIRTLPTVGLQEPKGEPRHALRLLRPRAGHGSRRAREVAGRGDGRAGHRQPAGAGHRAGDDQEGPRNRALAEPGAGRQGRQGLGGGHRGGQAAGQGGRPGRHRPPAERRGQHPHRRRVQGVLRRAAGRHGRPGRGRRQAEPEWRAQHQARRAGHHHDREVHPAQPGRHDDDSMRVAVLAGGRSSEHDVSLASGAAVRAGLEQAGHEAIDLRIERDGTWRRDGEELALSPGRGLLDADVAFPVLHGPFGEDGTVQGLLEILDVPYVGAGVLASALCMDKVLFKNLMAEAGVPQVGYAAVTEARWRAEPDAVRRELAMLGTPVFVKPARLGSSVGIGKVTGEAELASALEDVFGHDPLAIVEAMASGLEVECSVLGNEEPIASQPGEIVLSGGADWYDYEAKYTPGGMELVVPARIPDAARERVRALAVEAFARAGVSGLARVDFFVDGDEVLVNELNTMPGFTETSVYAKLFDASGIPYPELLDRLCRLAVERHEGARAYRY